MASSTPKTKRHATIDYRNPICAGHLYKQNKIGSFFNKRYFALYPNYLVYYAHEMDYRKDVEISTLEHRHGAYHLEGIYLTHCQKKPDGAKYCFIAHLPSKSNNRHEILLNCKSQADRKIWMDKLQAQNSKLVHRQCQGDGQGSPQLTVPPIRGHQRQPSCGGEVDKIASGSSYKTLKLWEFHDNIFTTVFKIGEIFVSSIKKSGCGEMNVKDGDSDEEHPVD